MRQRVRAAFPRRKAACLAPRLGLTVIRASLQRRKENRPGRVKGKAFESRRRNAMPEIKLYEPPQLLVDWNRLGGEDRKCDAPAHSHTTAHHEVTCAYRAGCRGASCSSTSSSGDRRAPPVHSLQALFPHAIVTAPAQLPHRIYGRQRARRPDRSLGVHCDDDGHVPDVDAADDVHQPLPRRGSAHQRHVPSPIISYPPPSPRHAVV
jgi:hypothetical protein